MTLEQVNAAGQSAKKLGLKIKGVVGRNNKTDWGLEMIEPKETTVWTVDEYNRLIGQRQRQLDAAFNPADLIKAIKHP
jgi:hypothetical protein